MKINPGTLLRKIWKYNEKSIFFPFFNTDRNAPKVFFRTVIIEHFIRKLLLKLTLDLGKCPNQKTHESESAGFLFWALPVVQN